MQNNPIQCIIIVITLLARRGGNEMHHVYAFSLSIFLLRILVRGDGDQGDKIISTPKGPQNDHDKNLVSLEQATKRLIPQPQATAALRVSSVKLNYSNSIGAIETLKSTGGKALPEPLQVSDARVSSITKHSRSEKMLTGTATIASSRSGTVESIITTVTINPTRTKISSCIYGCSMITLATKMGEAKTTVVTALPLTLPCSQMICPPCGCTTKTINVFGGPVITTITPPVSQVFVTAPFTITYITVTTTVTSCTATTYLRPAIVTVLSTSTVTSTRSRSYTTLTQYSTVRMTPRPKGTTCLPIPNKAYPLDYDHAETVGSSLPTIDCPGREGGYILRATKISSANHERLCWNGVCRWSFMADHQELANAKDSRDHGVERNTCSFGDMVNSSPTTTMMTTTITVERPLAITHIDVGSICSTYIICNPQQFSCPTQVKSLPQLQKFLQQMQSSEPEATGLMMDGVILQNLPPPRAIPAYEDSGSSSRGKKDLGPSIIFAKDDKPEKSIINGAPAPNASERPQVLNHVEPMRAQHPTEVSLSPAGDVVMGQKIEITGEQDVKDTTRENERAVQGASSKNAGARLWSISILGATCTLLSSFLLFLLR